MLGEIICKSFHFSFIGGLNLSKVSVKGVAAALEKNAVENVESKGIKAHFRYPLNCDHVNCKF